MGYKKSIHKMLIIRLVLISSAVALGLGTLTYILQFKAVDDEVADRATASAQALRWLIMDNLNAPNLGDHAKLRRTIQQIFDERTRPKDGSFILVQILDPDFKIVATARDRSYTPGPGDLDYTRESLDRSILQKEGFWQKMDRRNSRVIIHLATQIANTSGRRAGYVEGIFVVSPDFIARARGKVWLTVLAVVAVVSLTTLILYPAIVRLLRDLMALSSSLLHANLELLSVLGSAVAKRDSDTDSHNYRVTIYAVALARALGLEDDEIRSLLKGAFLHDVGKIGIRDAILRKPGKLTAEEFEEMKKHIQYGIDIISSAAWLKDAAAVVASHHEKYDGSGYDQNIRNGDIPRIARIFAVADVFDALTSTRPYKPPLGLAETMAILRDGRATHFDPQILDTFQTIAPALYAQYANRDDAGLRDDLNQIMMHYYTPNLFNQPQ